MTALLVTLVVASWAAGLAWFLLEVRRAPDEAEMWPERESLR